MVFGVLTAARIEIQNTDASIQISDLESGEIVFAYSADKPNSAHGKRSTAEACAKHVKEKIESKK